MRLFFLSMPLLLCSPSPADNEVNQVDPVRKWIDHQSSVNSVEASFLQERRLKALKLPIINNGKLWFKSPASFRWQIGTPPESVAINRDGQHLLVRPKKKSGEFFSRASSKSLQHDSGLRFFDVGFPRSHKEFSEKFTVNSVTLKDGSYFITVKVNDIRTSLALRKIVFQVNSTNFSTQGIVMRFRDSSSVITRFSRVRENVKVEDSLFEFDVSDYEMTNRD